MKTLIWPVGIVLGFAAGIAVGAVLFGNSSPPRQLPNELADDSPANERTQSADPPAETPDQPQREQPRATRPATPAAKPLPDVENDPLVAYLRTVELDPLPTGDGVITGRVLDTDERPVEGVHIQLTPPQGRGRVPYTGFQHPAGQLWAGLAKDVRELTRMRSRWQPAELQTRTGPDGSFRVGGLGDVNYFVFAQHPDYVIKRPPGPQRNRPGDNIEFTATAAVTVRVEVSGQVDVTRDDLLVSHRHMGVNHFDIPVRNEDRDGVWTLQVSPGMHTFAARCSNPPLRSQTVLLRVDAGSGPHEVNLTIEEKGIIRGTVEFLGGELQSEVSVICVPLEGDADGDKELRAALKMHGGLRSSRVDGHFTIGGAAAGRYIVAAHADSEVFATREINHDGSVSEVSLEITSPQEAITCIVSAPPGQSFGRLRFSIALPDGNTREWLQAWAIGAGEFRLALPKREFQPPVDLVAQHGTAAARATLNYLGAQRVELAFAPTGAVVIDRAGWTVPAGTVRKVRILDEAGGVLANARDIGQSRDYMVISNAPLGRWRLEVRLNIRGDAIVEAVQDVEVTAEGTLVKPQLLELHKVELTFGKSTSVPVQITGKYALGEFELRTSLHEGSLRLDYLPAGQYTVKWRPDHQSREERTQYFNVPGPAKVALTE